jgi:hypothetical protein
VDVIFQRRTSRARLLAGSLWHASVILIDQLFQDIHILHGKDRITRKDSRNLGSFRPATAVCSRILEDTETLSLSIG